MEGDFFQCDVRAKKSTLRKENEEKANTHTFTALGRRQGFQFKVILSYKAGSRSAWALILFLRIPKRNGGGGQ